MTYTLLTANGSIKQFYVKSVADLYQRLYGGVVFTSQVLDTVAQPDTMATY
jgi:hypothetical protein